MHGAIHSLPGDGTFAQNEVTGLFTLHTYTPCP